MNCLPIYSLLMILILSLSSCMVEDSSDVNQDRIYTDYEVFYNSNTDKTWVVARFRFGNAAGTLLELTDPAEVTFNGEVLPFNALFAGHYKEYAGQVTNGTFEYTNTDDISFVNALPTYESIAFPNDLDTLRHSASYDLIWDGTALSADQHVGIFAGSWTWGQDAAFLQAGAGANNIVLGTNQLDDLPPGPTTLYMDRSTDVEVTDGTEAGGRIRGKFRAENRVVQVVE